MHWDRLYVAIQKYGFPVSSDDFWHKWDMNVTAEAMSMCTYQNGGQMMAGIPKEVMDRIAEKETAAGIVWG